MNDSQFRALVEQSWRRALTENEQTQLAAWFVLHPETRASWEEEAALNLSLQELPDAPLPSNFTSLVLQAAQREATFPANTAGTRPSPSLWRRVTWHLAWALLMVCGLWFGYHAHHVHQAKERQDVATGLSALAKVATLSDLAVLEDFDAIQRLTHASAEDEELYAVLNQ